MTVIAYRSGHLAADTMASSSDGYIRRPYEVQKVAKTVDGCLLGRTGSIEESLAVWMSLMDGQKPEKFDLENSCIIHVSPSMRVRIYVGKGYSDSKMQFNAWGSGTEGALAALHLGKSAVEAVELAIKMYPSCGGSVNVVSLGED